MLICSFAIMPRAHPNSMHLVFLVFSDKSISLEALNSSSAFISIVMILTLHRVSSKHALIKLTNLI